jgi:DNA-binding MarR family transcriptional regulator
MKTTSAEKESLLKMVKSGKLKTLQVKVLSAVMHYKNITSGEASNLLKITPQNAEKRLSELNKLGLVYPQGKRYNLSTDNNQSVYYYEPNQKQQKTIAQSYASKSIDRSLSNLVKHEVISEEERGNLLKEFLNDKLFN